MDILAYIWSPAVADKTLDQFFHSKASFDLLHRSDTICQTTFVQGRFNTWFSSVIGLKLPHICHHCKSTINANAQITTQKDEVCPRNWLPRRPHFGGLQQDLPHLPSPLHWVWPPLTDHPLRCSTPPFAEVDPLSQSRKCFPCNAHKSKNLPN